MSGHWRISAYSSETVTLNDHDDKSRRGYERLLLLKLQARSLPEIFWTRPPASSLHDRQGGRPKASLAPFVWNNSKWYTTWPRNSEANINSGCVWQSEKETRMHQAESELRYVERARLSVSERTRAPLTAPKSICNSALHCSLLHDA